ncbi:hypothetical protein BD324DRAFT_624655 [Kockovaella imperatae]|uniref:CAP-Gly domain-containing protein n=1 Tax=Kockovaella imperatae TaxID=4999 RepID=A0A1Y1UHQ8_9TREE|nr:hypothetical protein BD324DRAFT_624655 [Kockovaella imperatae]ORX37067.1 hypothetical protein BD324DRAFT_624655 [Kockovaella imperatae]
MSRLPTISTPSRASTSTTSLPTPTSRRPRSSLGVSQHRPSSREMDDPAAELALQEALKHRPPSSLRNVVHSTNALEANDPDTPTGLGASTLKTPASMLRAKTPLGLGHGQHPTTPSASRAVSRARPSIGSATPLTNRRTSMASSTTTSTTPYGARRPESRLAGGSGAEHWSPAIGERVRMQAMGMEGTLRYLGETEFKAGVWAGVELEGGFAGKGKNDGSVNGVTYFACPPLCGVFILAVKLSPPTSGVSRPASAASSHLSFASSASYISGRATPSIDRAMRSSTAATTPSRVNRAVSSARPSLAPDDDSRPVKTLLGTSSSSNAAIAESKITAGSRASKYIGMTAKQLETARSGTLSASVRSTTATPRPSRVSIGGPGTGRPRASLGASLATPRPRAPRASHAADVMPPPPSPGNVDRAVYGQQAKLEEELRQLRERNANLEDQLFSLNSAASQHSPDDTEALREQADMLRRELDASHGEVDEATKLAEELKLAQEGLQSIVDEKDKQLGELRRDMQVAAERAQGELDAGMEAKTAEIRRLQDRADLAEQDGAEMRALVEELTQAGQATISLYENKQYDLEDKIRSLEEKSRLLEERLVKAREESEAAASTQSTSKREAISAAEIDNETLNAQLKHFQNRVSILEEELEEAQSRAEADAESWKARINKAKLAEKAHVDKEREAREEIKRLERGANGAKTRIQEIENALKENRGLLEIARAEIESMRGEVAEVASLRTALQNAADKDKMLSDAQDEIQALKTKLDQAAGAESQVAELQVKIGALESQIAKLNTNAQTNSPAMQRGRLSSGSSDDAEKRMRGFQHIISDLSAENAELKDKYQNLVEEVDLLKEENKLLEETRELSGGVGSEAESSKETDAAQATIKRQEQTIQELNREMAELESLIESKIYREDELENRLQDLERQLDKQRAMSAPHRDGSPVPSGHSRTASTATAASGRSGISAVSSAMSGSHSNEQCELCEGPHDLDACPVFAGNMMPDTGKKVNGAQRTGGKWCADCESTAHDTVQCPMAEDVF